MNAAGSIERKPRRRGDAARRFGPAFPDSESCLTALLAWKRPQLLRGVARDFLMTFTYNSESVRVVLERYV